VKYDYLCGVEINNHYKPLNLFNTMRKILSLALMWLVAATGLANAQIVETRPTPLQETSKDVVVVYHSDSGNKELAGFTGDMYAHAGVITNKSNGNWAYAPSKWGDNNEKYKLTNVGKDTWELNIGDIRTYFGISDADEHVEKLAFVFRSADTTKQGKTESDGDIFIDVHEGGLAIELTTDAASVILNPQKINVAVNVSAEADITIYLNDDVVASASKATVCPATLELKDYNRYNLRAVAKAGDETVEAAKSFILAPACQQVEFPGGVPAMGVTEGENGSYYFCIAAPGKNHAILVSDKDGYTPELENVMNYQDYQGVRYFWAKVDNIADGEDFIYYFIVDGNIKVADPYCHLVLDPYSDKWLENLWDGAPAYPYDKMDDAVLSVFNSKMDDYAWEHKDDFVIPDHDKLIVYELLLRDFNGNHSTADGTIDAAYRRLNYLEMLGVNAIELLPVMEFNGNNSWGYNTNFYMALDKAYGSPAELKKFVDCAHSKGMAVILDIVFNQSDGLHPWYQMYNISENPFYNAKAPHDYSVLNDWNQDNALVEQQWVDAIKYWMTAYDVDGFRFDLVKGLGDNDSYAAGTEAYNSSRVERMKRLHAAIKSVKPDGIHINENLAGAKEENEMAADGQLNWSNMNNASCQVAMGYQSDSNTAGFYSPDNGGRQWGSTISYAESHDEERMGFKQGKWGVDGVKGNRAMSTRRLGSVAALMLMTPGSHMIWQFAELGADETTKNSDGSNNTDPKKVLWYRLLDGDNDYAGLHRTYTELNWIRRNNPHLFSADAEISMNHSAWEKGRFIRLAAGEDELLLMVNPVGEEAVTLEYDVNKMTADNFKVVSKSYKTDPKAKVESGKAICEVPAGGYVILTTAKTVSVDNVVGDELDAASAPRVYGGNGRVVIDGAYSIARVYNLSGRSVGIDNLLPGVYVAVVDGISTKVLVK